MRADVLKALIKAHVDDDQDGFRKAALQAASAESSAGHIRVAEQLRSLIRDLPVEMQTKPKVVDLARPRGDLADILEGGFRQERLRDIVLHDDVQRELDRVLEENRARAELEKWAVSPRRRLLFCGPPGCGKTLAAAVLAGELGVPLMTVRLDALFSRFLGATATHLRAVFNEMPRRPGVYLFDEFDAVGKTRGDSQDVGELNRIVTSFLQMVDADQSPSILIAATNHPELLDRAVFRRFEVQLSFERPDVTQLEFLIRMRLAVFELAERTVKATAKSARGLSFAEAAQVCDDAIRTMALDGRTTVTAEDLRVAVNRAGKTAVRMVTKRGRSTAKGDGARKIGQKSAGSKPKSATLPSKPPKKPAGKRAAGKKRSAAASSSRPKRAKQ